MMRVFVMASASLLLFAGPFEWHGRERSGAAGTGAGREPLEAGTADASAVRAQPAEHAAARIEVLLHDRDVSRRAAAARQLEAQPALARQAVPALIAGLRADLDYGVREACADALGRAGVSTAVVRRALYEAATLSRHAEGQERFWARRYNQRSYFHVRYASARALARLGPEGVATALSILEAEEGHVEAAELLGTLAGPEVEAALRRYRERKERAPAPGLHDGANRRAGGAV